MKIQRKVSRLVENESEILCNYLLEKIPFGRANVFVKMLAENSCNRDEEMKFLRNILEQRFNSSTVQKHAKRRNQCDQIIPGLYLGDCAAATSLNCLHLLGITHVLNAAEGIDSNQIMTGSDFYQGTCISYHGISADDNESYDLSKHFDEACNFIKQVIGTKAEPKKNGVILVHCMAGISRSATFVTAYLMRDYEMNLTEALRTISEARFIYPNDGFLKSLINFNNKLGYKK